MRELYFQKALNLTSISNLGFNDYSTEQTSQRFRKFITIFEIIAKTEIFTSLLCSLIHMIFVCYPANVYYANYKQFKQWRRYEISARCNGFPSICWKQQSKQTSLERQCETTLFQIEIVEKIFRKLHDLLRLNKIPLEKKKENFSSSCWQFTSYSPS